MRRIVVAVALTVLAACSGSDDGSKEQVGAGSKVTAQYGERGISVTLTLDRGTVTVGERVWAEATIENTTKSSVWWEGGGCGYPATLNLLPGLKDPPGLNPLDLWDGDPTGLAAWLAENNGSSRDLEGIPGRRPVDCPTNVKPTELRAGDKLHHRAALDVRALPGPLPAGGDYTVVARFRPYESAPAGTSDRPDQFNIATEARLRVVEDPRRTAPDAAIKTLAAHRHVAAFVDQEKRAVQGFDNAFFVEVTWWKGAWEMWVDGMLGGFGGRDPKLRLRFDPEKQQVVDARIVHDRNDGGDDPDLDPAPNNKPDEVLPLP